MGSTAGDSRRRRIAIPRRPSGTTRAPHTAGLFSIADVGSTQRPRGQRADGSPALRLFRLRSGLNCGKSARYRTNTTGCGRNKAWWQNLRCDGAYGCHLRLLRIIRTIHSVFFFHGLRFFRTIRVIIRILARCKADPASLCFSCFSCFSCGAACTSLCNTIGDEFERRRASATRESRVSASRWSVCWLPAAVLSTIVVLLSLNVTISSVT